MTAFGVRWPFGGSRVCCVGGEATCDMSDMSTRCRASSLIAILFPAELRPAEVRLLAIGILTSVTAKGLALFALSFNVDDLWYWRVHFDYYTVGNLALRDGRFTLPLVATLADALSVNLPRATTLSGAVLILSEISCGLILCRLWRITHDICASGIVVGVMCAHPYFTDIYTWKMSMFTGGFRLRLLWGHFL